MKLYNMNGSPQVDRPALRGREDVIQPLLPEDPADGGRHQRCAAIHASAAAPASLRLSRLSRSIRRVAR